MKPINLDRMFDLVCHMNRNQGEDYEFDKKKGVVLNYVQQGVVLHKSLQCFMQGVGVQEEKTGKIIQAFTGSSELPILTKDVFNVTQDVPAFDTFWQLAFKGVRLKKGQLAWEIADVATGLTFDIVPEGGKAKFYGITGAKVPVTIDKYGAGIGVTWEMIEGRKLYQFIDLMNTVRGKLNDLWANIHYTLLEAAADDTAITYQLTGTEPILDRDIATINLAYETIGDACKAKGYGDVANAKMILYASPKLKARLNHAMRVTSADVARGRVAAGAGGIVEYNVDVRYTWNANIPANKGVMILPGNKIQNSVYMQELSLSEKDIETLSEMRTYWTAFGAVVGDLEQTCEPAFAD